MVRAVAPGRYDGHKSLCGNREELVGENVYPMAGSGGGRSVQSLEWCTSPKRCH